MFYAKSTGGFYDPTIHGDNIPADAVEITEEQHNELIEGQSQGKRIVADENGFPVLADPPAPTASEIWQRIKAKRDQLQEAGCPVAGYWFHNDVKSRTQWERMANRAAGVADAEPYLIGGVAVEWKTMTGDKVPLTAGLIRQVVEAFEVREATIFATAEYHNAALRSLATVEEVAAYDFSAGWPVAFEP